MKQILQNPRSGDLELVEVPAPAVGAGEVLVRTCFSVVSPAVEGPSSGDIRRASLTTGSTGVRAMARKTRLDPKCWISSGLTA